jgi:hypothetical protein
MDVNLTRYDGGGHANLKDPGEFRRHYHQQHEQHNGGGGEHTPHGGVSPLKNPPHSMEELLGAHPSAAEAAADDAAAAGVIPAPTTQLSSLRTGDHDEIIADYLSSLLPIYRRHGVKRRYRRAQYLRKGALRSRMAVSRLFAFHLKRADALRVMSAARYVVVANARCCDVLSYYA